jgi:hypothetical protein
MSPPQLAAEPLPHGNAEPEADHPSLASLQNLMEAVRDRQEGHERLLRFIAECVAPKGEDTSQINDLIGLLIAKIDGQSAMIRGIAGLIQRQGRTLPGAVVQAFDNGGASAEGATAKGNGANGHGRSRP